jgi:hydroxycarboxylate dehydrogenase B
MTAAANFFLASDLKLLGSSVLARLGAPPAAAEKVAEHLVTAHLMGLVSHGVIRFPQYANDISAGRIRATAEPQVVASTATTAVVDGGSGFGQLTASAATNAAVDRAREAGVAVVATRRCNHVGRLGAFVEQAARGGVIAIAVAAIPRSGHFVVPWAGIDGRFGTNPIAYGFPTSGDPIVGDFATSVIPEGRVRTARNKGAELPEGAVVDAEGRPTRDPKAFYGPPRGALLPFGGVVGHKGYGLAMLVELLGATLLGDSTSDDERSINSFTIIAIDPAAFGPSAEVTAASDALVAYVRSSRPAPGVSAVQVPGEPEFTALRAAGSAPTISLDPETARQLDDVARSLDLHLPAPVVAERGNAS